MKANVDQYPLFPNTSVHIVHPQNNMYTMAEQNNYTVADL